MVSLVGSPQVYSNELSRRHGSVQKTYVCTLHSILLFYYRYNYYSNSWVTSIRSRINLMYVDQQTYIQTVMFLFMPVITVFIVSFFMLGDLPWDDDDDDDDGGGGIMIPAYNPV